MIRRILIFAAILLVLDVYVFSSFRNFFTNQQLKQGFKWFYLISMLLSYACFALIVVKFDNRPTQASLWMNLWFGYTFAFVVLKIGLVLTALFDDIVRIIEFVGRFVWRIFLNPESEVKFSSRRKFIGQVGLGLASIPFLSMLYGITKGKYNYKIKEVALTFKNLPKAFDGLKIVHISDIHSGSFDDFNEVKHGVELIQAQNPDLILFTGDLVNNEAQEIVPYKDLFASLQAPLGKISSLGNHDYGTHKRWNSAQEKEQNLLELFEHQKDMGFQLLNNQNIKLEKEGETLAIVGVENWGKPPFPQKGNLDQALQGTHPENFKILLSHDPTHWDEKVIPHAQHIDLTLSGHTHGMQFGVEIPGIKWSPSKYIYKRWAGLYQNNKQYLYVNRGFGFLGFPGRVGIWPEITVLTLEKEA
ncbi:metallophosphoesterase [Ochrovirga pacifica]|uniref:metallophosphoesterase n=1 Tax=Ochrovirga pacifica TaxID=1042376 RepID=UPI00025597DE|nr:metallophosphoesterase [Ochrovirga pacifica]